MTQNHPAPERISRLIEVQRSAALRVDLRDRYSTDFVAGVDQAFLDDRIISGAVVLGPFMEVMADARCIMPAAFPYIPGLLFFREGAAAMRALKRLRQRPSLLFVDGCGINHPRMAGLASMIGLLLDLPTIGITKNLLCGECELPEKPGRAAHLFLHGEQVGHILRSKEGCRPIVISPGHRVSVSSSLDLTRKYLHGSKLPEPCRLAHLHANQIKRELGLRP